MSANAYCRGLKVRLGLTAVLGAALLAASAAAAPPSQGTPAESSAGLPWWLQPVMHTDQENLFLLWMDVTFGPGWQKVIPTPVVESLWLSFGACQAA